MISIYNRRFMRITEEYKVLIRTCDAIDSVTKKNIDVMTLEYSQRGMRILSDKEIPVDHKLCFEFGNDFVVPNLFGIAKVCWHWKFEGIPQSYVAGLLFIDDFSTGILATQDNLQWGSHVPHGNQ